MGQAAWSLLKNRTAALTARAEAVGDEFVAKRDGDGSKNEREQRVRMGGGDHQPYECTGDPIGNDNAKVGGEPSRHPQERYAWS